LLFVPIAKSNKEKSGLSVQVFVAVIQFKKGDRDSISILTDPLRGACPFGLTFQSSNKPYF
jgi:hypothetical protein